MTAWEQLRANSTLPSGTAWQLLSSPRRSGLIINDGVAVEVAEMPVEVEVLLDAVEASVEDNAIVVELDDTGIEAEVTE